MIFEKSLAPFISQSNLYRTITWRLRCLPDFIVIGAQKSGTSSLHSYLSQHPQLISASTKEVHFFDGDTEPRKDSFAQGKAYYQNHFPLKWKVIDCQTFEATPSYLFDPIAPKRISDLIPNVKLIAILRNPTESAISHYFHEKRKGNEPLPLMEALQAEEKRLKPALDGKHYRDHILRTKSYKSRGIYYEQLKRYFEHFSKDKIFITSSEQFFENPGNILRQIFQFIGVDSDYTIKNLQPRTVGKNKNQISPEVFDYLNDYFWTYNHLLYELLGDNYGW